MANKKRLIDFDNCPACGDELYAMTDERLPPNEFYDGDKVFCGAKPSCGEVGSMTADGETCYVVFNYDDELPEFKVAGNPSDSETAGPREA